MRRPEHEPKRAFFSVADKTGIERVAARLVALGYEVDSSGGTCKYLREHGIKARNVNAPRGRKEALGALFASWGRQGTEEIIDDLLPVFGVEPEDIGLGMPIMLDHRVATLGAPTHGGLLALATPEHDAERKLHGIPWYDIVFVDFYPFRDGIAKPDITLEQAIELIDIGGPTLVKSGAKGDRFVVCDPADREQVLECLEKGNSYEQELLRTELRAKAFYVVSRYYGDVARFMGGDDYFVEFAEMVARCEYGENPHQQFAALYSTGSNDALALPRFKQIAGRPLSYINWTDLDRGVEQMVRIAATFEANGWPVPCIALILKHGNPSGACFADGPHDALRGAIEGNARSSSGGFVLVNFTIDSGAAEIIRTWKGNRVVDGVAASAFLKSAIGVFERKDEGKCRLLENDALLKLGRASLRTGRESRRVRGGVLVQDVPRFVWDWDHPNLAIFGTLTDDLKKNLAFAAAITGTSNSNTVLLTAGNMLIGLGAGQQDRVEAADLACRRAVGAGHSTVGALAASDSFFPYDDGPKVLGAAGIKAILSVSGSVRDRDTVAYCEETGIALALIPVKDGRMFFAH